MAFALFFLGAIFGSFLDVLAMRYRPEQSLFAAKSLGGRSHCPHCGTQLTWLELVPLASFLWQRGRCRSCGTRISPEHFFVEIVSGFIFMIVPPMVSHGGIYLHSSPLVSAILSAIWIAAFWTLLLITLIDFRWQIIPDEANGILVGLGILLAIFESKTIVAPYNSFLGPYGLLFGVEAHPWLNAGLGLLVGILFFGIIIAITRGRGMGMGDLKLAAALGVLFRFPDILVLSCLAFVVGSIFGIIAIASKGKTLKSAVPFGPFIALAAIILFFFGEPLARAYFSLIS